MSREGRILKAAAQLFYERGFHRVGVDEIGEAAGVSGPAIYRHFSGKDELLAVLFDQAMDRLLARSQAGQGQPDAELDALIRRHAEFVLSDRALVSVFAREDRSLAEPFRKRIRERRREHVDHWIDVLQRCYPERGREELISAAHAAIGLLASVAHWPLAARRTKRLPDMLVRIVHRGLAAAGEPAG